MSPLQDIGGALVPTVGGLVRLSGSNLGGAALTGNIIALFDNGGGSIGGSNLIIVNFTQDALLVLVPPGDGTNHTLQVQHSRLLK